ncbi:MAG: hypothetical protein JSS89_00705 [Bacteroidetes bacterium]|nr:hypothetical protein [Bacteroidota bacterium]
MTTYHEIERVPRGLRILLLVLLTMEATVMSIAFIATSVTNGADVGEVIGFTSAAVLLPALLFILLLRTTLEVTVDASGVSVIMRPFQRKVRHYAWTEIADISTRSVSPIGEFGGWGIRGWGKKIGYIWDGNNCIDVLTTSGKRVVVSITDAGSARAAIEENRPHTER